MNTTKCLKILITVSTFLAVLFFFLYLRTVSFPSGGGQIKASPDGNFIAEANSLANENPLSNSKNIYGEFVLKRSNGALVVTRVIINPLGTDDAMSFRYLPNLIAWATNSAEVSFSTPRMSLTLSATNRQ
jgi:hypothetical protein